MNCRSLDSLVTPYVDGELADDDRLAVDAHLRACPPCYSRVAAERTTHALIREHKAAFDQPAAPDALRTRCAELARRADAGLTARAPSWTAARWRARSSP